MVIQLYKCEKCLRSFHNLKLDILTSYINVCTSSNHHYFRIFLILINRMKKPFYKSNKLFLNSHANELTSAFKTVLFLSSSSLSSYDWFRTMAIDGTGCIIIFILCIYFDLFLCLDKQSTPQILLFIPLRRVQLFFLSTKCVPLFNIQSIHLYSL